MNIPGCYLPSTHIIFKKKKKWKKKKKRKKSGSRPLVFVQFFDELAF